MNRFLVPAGVFAAIVVLLGIGLFFDPRVVPSPLVGKTAPPFDLPQLHEPGLRTGDADLRGKVSLLNVWASWCVACRYEHGYLMKLAGEARVPIYGLNYKDERDDALAWLKLHGNPYTLSASDREGKVGMDFGVYGVPETFVVDREGVIRYKHIGPLDRESLEKQILPLLDQLAAGGG